MKTPYMRSVVMDNLINVRGYTPYCGAFECTHMWPRTRYDTAKEQFRCDCGWVSTFEPEFIQEYKDKWGIK